VCLQRPIGVCGRVAWGAVGLPKVSLEVRWLSLAHILLKQAAIEQNKKMVAQG